MQPRRRTKLAREHEATRSTPACTSDCFVLTGLQTSSELRANTSTGLTIHDEVGQSIGVSSNSAYPGGCGQKAILDETIKKGQGGPAARGQIIAILRT